MAAHRIVLTGGGTGGHIYPALAVAEALRDESEIEAILYIGAEGHLEERLAQEQGLEFVGLSVSGMPRKFSAKFPGWMLQMFSAIYTTKAILKKFRPTVVLGTGGYASAPPLAAAALLSVPYAIHEPDAHPGLVNRTFARGAKLVSLGMEGARGRLKPEHGKLLVNGNPVRKSFVSPMGRDAAAAVLGLRPDYPTVLITGGSQGAQALNEATLAALPELLALDPPIQIVHQVGEKNFADFKQRIDLSVIQTGRYHIRPYFSDLSLAYAVCDLAVCRAGAMTIAELSVMGVPAIFVPYPYAAQDHQTHNARFVESKGAAAVLLQSDLSETGLTRTIASLLCDLDKLHAMKRSMSEMGKPQAAQLIAAELKQISYEYQSGAAVSAR